MTVAQIFRQAAASVRRGPWGQLSTLNNCALAHLCLGAGREPLLAYTDKKMVPVYRALVQALDLPRHSSSRLCDDDMSRIYGWNDFNCRTAEDVAIGLEFAANVADHHQPATALPAPEQELVTC